MSFNKIVRIQGLVKSVTTDNIIDLFLPFGPLTSVNLPIDEKTGNHMGYAYVEYECEADAQEAIFNKNNSQYCGSCIICEMEVAKDTSPEATLARREYLARTCAIWNIPVGKKSKGK